MKPQGFASDLLGYMVERKFQPGEQLPTLNELSAELGVSVNKLREQLEVARALGLVDVRPRAGIRAKAYSFLPAVRLSLLFALLMDRSNFEAFSALRTAIEVGFWREAVSRLLPEDYERLDGLVKQAWAGLGDSPIRIPHREHREFHLTIFSRLDNPFASALLEAFWEAYEVTEYHVYADYQYLREVWAYHQRILEALCAGDVEGSLAAFIDHTRLIRYRHSTGSEHPLPTGVSAMPPNGAVAPATDSPPRPARTE